MGTNYYLREKICEHCGRYDEIHIGKSSAGWCFSLHVIPERGLNSLDDWRRQLLRGRIFNEYSDELNVDAMLNLITERTGIDRSEKLPDSYYRENEAIPGPNNLLRHASRYCVGHGEGPWDLIEGGFS